MMLSLCGKIFFVIWRWERFRQASIDGTKEVALAVATTLVVISVLVPWLFAGNCWPIF